MLQQILYFSPILGILSLIGLMLGKDNLNNRFGTNIVWYLCFGVSVIYLIILSCDLIDRITNV